MDLIETKEFSQSRHPWEISRTESILRTVKDKLLDAQCVDLGAGDLFFVRELAGYTEKPVYAVDINYPSEGKEDKIILLKGISKIPKKSVDLIFLMDLLEHIENEYLFLNNLLDLLRDGGRFVIAVPACRFLFSLHDISLKHYRRYNRKQLHQLIIKLDLKIEEMFYFYLCPFFMRLFQKSFVKSGIRKEVSGVNKWKFGTDNFFTKSIIKMLNIDFVIHKLLSRYGLFLPGLSLCAICRKK